jgi:sigma-B regulation protein RsbU (phosphoserine phosphatase)
MLCVGVPVGLVRLRDPVAYWLSVGLLLIGSFLALIPISLVPIEVAVPAWIMAMYWIVSAVGASLTAPIAVRVLSVFPHRTTLGDWLLRRLPLFTAVFAFAAAGAVAKATQKFLATENRILGALASLEHIGLDYLVAFGAVGLASVMLGAQFIGTRRRSRGRLKTLATGFAISVAGGVLVLVLIALVGIGVLSVRAFHYALVVPVMPMLACAPISLAYSVLARRVFGIRFIIRRGMQHFLLSRGMLLLEGTALFLILEETIRHGRSWMSSSTPWVAGTSIAVSLAAVLGLMRVNRPLLLHLDRRFFREAYDARRVMFEVSRQISLSRDQDEILSATGASISSALHPSRVAVFLQGVGDDSIQLAWMSGPWGAARCGSAETAVSVRTARIAHGIKMIREGQAWAAVHPEEGWRAKSMEEGPPAFELLVGIPASEGVAGYIGLAAKLSEEPYSKEDKELLLTVASATGLALENIELVAVATRERELSKEIELARQVQQGFFPRELPVYDGWDFAGVCLPAKEVGGDYYDVIRIDSKHVAIALGDVADKGLGPSLVMSTVHGIVRSHLSRKRYMLSELMTELNDYLVSSTSPGMFITLFIGVLNTRTGDLHYVNGGHNPPLLIRCEDKTATRLLDGDMLVGIMADVSYREQSLTMGDGDRLVIFSDGITEAMNRSGDMFTEPRLMGVLSEASALKSLAALRAILDSVGDFAEGCTQSDDMTILVIDRVGVLQRVT